MADERVTIKIDVKADTSQIDRTKRKLAELCAQAEACEKQLNEYSGATKDLDRDLMDLDKTTSKATKNQGQSAKSTNSLTKAQKKLGYQVRDNRSKFDKLAGVLKTPFRLAVIGAAIETAGLALALSSVNGLLAVGRFLVKSYHVAMSGLAKAAAAAGLALATVAAAQRQYIAAQASGRYGGSFTASSQSLRTLTGDARLASLGMKTLTGAFQAASKNAPVTKGTASALAGLMDFAYLSGDIEKGTAALANFVSLVQKGGPGGKGVAEAAKELGPEFQKAFKEISRGGKATTQELMKAFAGGRLSQSAGISGTASNVSGSLVGQLKAAFVEAQLLFGDLGMAIIKDVQKAFEDLRKIFTRTFRQLAPTLIDFSPRFLDGLVRFTDKLASFLVTLMREYVPRVEGFFESMSKFWDKLTTGFEKFNAYLRQFSAASKIINEFFGKIFKDAIGGGLRRNFESFGSMLVKNQDEFDKFGDKLSNLITEIFRLFDAIRGAFFAALPAINGIVAAISMLVGAMGDLLNVLSGIGPYMAMMGLMGTAAIVPGRRGRGGFLRGRGGAGMIARNRGPLAAGALAMTAGQMFIPGEMGNILGVAGIGGFLGRKAAGSDKLRNALLNRSQTGKAGFVTRGAGGLAYRSAARFALGGATIAGGSYATGKLMEGVENRYDSDAAVITAGAAGGAATGAAAGAAFAPFTLGTSIVVGALAGAVIGGIAGWINSGKAKKESAKAGKAFAEDYANSVEEILGQNNMQLAAKALEQFSERAEEFAETQKRSGIAYDEAMKIWERRSEELQDTLDVMTDRTEVLSSVSGLAKDEIVELANSLKINLGDSSRSVMEILHQTGIAVRRFGEDWTHYVTDTFAMDLEEIATDVAILDSPIVKNEIANAFAEAIKEGGADRGASPFADFLQGILDQNLLTFGASGADKAMVAMMGEELGTGAAFFPGGFFPTRGISASDFTDEERQIYSNYIGRRKTSVAQGAAENLVSMLSERGSLPVGLTVENLAGLLAKGGSLTDIIAFGEKLATGQQFTSGPVITPYGATPGIPLEEQLDKLLSDFNIDLGQNIELEKTNDQKMLEGIADFKYGTGQFVSSIDDTFSIAVEKFDAAVDKMPGSDTSTPRHNIMNTLGTHSRFDAMISGKRSVMSGLRNWNLGSPSSDHAKGRAYDLVGQNLGLYRTAIQSAGGYAEFHGGASSRHLHVVPGSATPPIGDTATPYMGQVMTSPSGGNVTNVNMTVNASPGMDVNALASEVINRLEQETRSQNERY